MSDEADQIRRRMADLRSRSSDSAVELHAALGRVTDWKEHVRAHPLTAASIALAAGYFVVPKRQPLPLETPKASTKGKVKGEGATQEEVHTSSMAGGAIGGLIGNVIGSAVRGYLTNLLRQQLSTRLSGLHGMHHTPEAAQDSRR